MKLIAYDRNDGWVIAWAETGDMGDDVGAHLGENWDEMQDIKCPRDSEMADVWKSEHVAFTTKPEYRDKCFYWDSKRSVQKALRLIKFALENSERPMPDWAKTALENGWKAPKGWKP